MSQLLAQSLSFGTNPLDAVEQMLMHHDIAYDRPVEEEVVAETPGHWCQHKLWYRWEEALGLLVFTCSLDVRVPKASRPKIYALLGELNEKLWLGHFEICSEDGAVMFRHSLLAKESVDVSNEQVDALLEIATTECDRFYPALQAVLWANKPIDEAIELAMFDTCGEA